MVKIDDNVPVHFFHTLSFSFARAHTSFMSLYFVGQMKWKKKENEEPRCIRLYNWHNSSNKMLTQKEAKLFIHTQCVYLEICLVCYLFSFDLLCVCVRVICSLFGHSARTLSWTILYWNWEIIHRNYTICSSSICTSHIYQLPSPSPLTPTTTSLLCW